MEKIALAVLLLATVVSQGSCGAFKCYECLSSTIPACRDPFNATRVPLLNCRLRSLPSDSQGVRLFSGAPETEKGLRLDEGNYRAAGNYCVKIEFKVGSNSATQRGCTDMGTTVCENVKQQVLEMGGKLEHCSYCEGDKCNFAPSVSASVALILLAPVLASLRHRLPM